mmetsp:Transcript_8836/g.19963  ORF Transcript_8836/g.19963 Transcript_8836/m.19963 type:complete len:338 (+) Transcript_8836:71-1084(+)
MAEATRTKVPEEPTLAPTATESILAASNHYEALGLPVQIASSEVAKRRYYRLALVVHPDKNKEFQAEEAFKRLSTAFEVIGGADQVQYLNGLSTAPGRNCEDHRYANKKGDKTKRRNETRHDEETYASYKEEAANERRKPRKTLEEFLREWQNMQYEFDVAAEGVLNERRAKAIRTKEVRQASAADHKRNQEELAESFCEEVEGRASSWHKFRSGGSLKKQRSVLNSALQDRHFLCASEHAPPATMHEATYSQERKLGAEKIGLTGQNSKLQPESEATNSADPQNCNRSSDADVPCCLLCRRSFKDEAALLKHIGKSALHFKNATAKQPKQGRFFDG